MPKRYSRNHTFRLDRIRIELGTHFISLPLGVCALLTPFPLSFAGWVGVMTDFVFVFFDFFGVEVARVGLAFNDFDGNGVCPVLAVDSRTPSLSDESPSESSLCMNLETLPSEV